MPRFAANLTTLFNEVEFTERFGRASQAGFKGVEFQFPYAWDRRQLADLLAEHSLVQVLHNLPAGDEQAGEKGIACLPGRQSEFQDGVGLALEYAEALGCQRLHCMAGIISSGDDLDKVRETYIENLTWAAGMLAAANIRLLIEPINFYDIPGYYLNTTEQALSVIEDVASDNLFLQYDVYHMQIMEGNLTRTISNNLDIISHMQIADTPGRHEPGTGEVNFAYLLRYLDEAGYRGWVGLEYRPRRDTLRGLGWLRMLQPAG